MRVYGAAHSLWRAMRDFLFPPVCLLCGGACGPDVPLCDECCDVVRQTSRDFRLARNDVPAVDGVTVLLPYDRHCRTLVHALKYHGMPVLGPQLGAMLGAKLLDGGVSLDGALIVPVPLHYRKRAVRGYNQAGRIAEGIAAATGLTVRADLLVRTRHTGTQTALDESGRAANVADAFAVAGDASVIPDVTVILVDDVLTTGSTIAACAGTLQAAGATMVHAAVLATPVMGED